MISASASPVTPSPMRRLAFASRACSTSGKRDTSIALSIILTASGTRRSSSASSSAARSVNGLVIRLARLIEPSRHAP